MRRIASVDNKKWLAAPAKCQALIFTVTPALVLAISLSLSLCHSAWAPASHHFANALIFSVVLPVSSLHSTRSTRPLPHSAPTAAAFSFAQPFCPPCRPSTHLAYAAPTLPLLSCLLLASYGSFFFFFATFSIYFPSFFLQRFRIFTLIAKRTFILFMLRLNAFKGFSLCLLPLPLAATTSAPPFPSPSLARTRC